MRAIISVVSDRGRCLNRVEASKVNSEVFLSDLRAKVLPRLIEQHGDEAGNKEFDRKLNIIIEAFAVSIDASKADIETLQPSSGTASARLWRTFGLLDKFKSEECNQAAIDAFVMWEPVIFQAVTVTGGSSASNFQEQQKLRQLKARQRQAEARQLRIENQLRQIEQQQRNLLGCLQNYQLGVVACQ